jgi:hypothetical protein
MINQALTQAFKDTIKKLDLIKSGRLYNETTLDIKSEYNGNILNIYVNANAPDYLEYLIEFYPIIETWQQIPAVGEEISKEITPILERQIENVINNNAEVTDVIPFVYFTINGK